MSAHPNADPAPWHHIGWCTVIGPIALLLAWSAAVGALLLRQPPSAGSETAAGFIGR